PEPEGAVTRVEPHAPDLGPGRAQHPPERMEERPVRPLKKEKAAHERPAIDCPGCTIAPRGGENKALDAPRCQGSGSISSSVIAGGSEATRLSDVLACRVGVASSQIGRAHV